MRNDSRKFQLMIAGLMILVTMLVSLCANAQQAEITLDNGQMIKTTITASSDKQLFTTDGNFNISGISKVTFTVNEDRYNGVYERLEDAKVGVFFGANPWQREIVEEEEQNDVSQLKASINSAFLEFDKQRTAAKALQFLGSAVLTYTMAASWMNVQRTKDGEDPIEVKPWVPVAGGALLSVGIIVDLEAGKRLRIK